MFDINERHMDDDDFEAEDDVGHTNDKALSNLMYDHLSRHLGSMDNQSKYRKERMANRNF